MKKDVLEDSKFVIVERGDSKHGRPASLYRRQKLVKEHGKNGIYGQSGGGENKSSKSDTQQNVLSHQGANTLVSLTIIFTEGSYTPYQTPKWIILWVTNSTFVPGKDGRCLIWLQIHRLLYSAQLKRMSHGGIHGQHKAKGEETDTTLYWNH